MRLLLAGCPRRASFCVQGGVSQEGQHVPGELLTAFVRVVPPNPNAQAIAHAFRMNTGFFQRCELVKMRAMLMGTRGQRQKALRIMMLSSPPTEVLENWPESGGGEEVRSSGQEDVFMFVSCSSSRGSTAGEGNIAGLICAGVRLSLCLGLDENNDRPSSPRQ